MQGRTGSAQDRSTNPIAAHAKALASILLAASAGLVPAHADPTGTPIGAFAQGDRTVPVYELEQVLSDAGGRDQFAIELAYRLRAFTARAGVEACARICRAESEPRWGASLVTIGSHAACPRTRTCPRGMVPTEVDIHSHVHVTSYAPSTLDRLFLARTYRPGEWVATVPERFSPSDFRTGPGYMVNRRTLLFQDGERAVRVVWRMGDGLPAVPAAASASP